MTVRRYRPVVIQIVWPDGRLIGCMIHVGQQWFGPFMTIGGAGLT